MTVADDFGLTFEESEAIEELKKRMRNYVNQQIYEDTDLFYRFLKARDFDLHQAEIMLRKHLQWRKEKGVDNIITDYNPPEGLDKYIPFSRFAYDKEGSLCRYVPLGNYDSKGLHSLAKYCDIEKTVIRIVELDEKAIRERHKNKRGKIPGYTYVYNMKNLSLALATDKNGIETLIKLAKMYQDNYPERLKAAVFFNVSTLFTVPFTIIKKFIASNVTRKFHVYGSTKWKEDLLNRIEIDELPAFLGGNKTDPDGNPLCKTFINHGDLVPENQRKFLSRDPCCKKIVLPRSSISEISMEVKLAGSLIQWELETKAKDVDFGVFLKENDCGNKNLTEVVPLSRINSQDFSHSGIYRCDKPGTYVLLFDNKYSWIWTKEIFYKATVVSPKEHNPDPEN